MLYSLARGVPGIACQHVGIHGTNVWNACPPAGGLEPACGGVLEHSNSRAWAESTDGRRMVDGWSTDGRRVADGWPTDGRRMADGWPTDTWPPSRGFPTSLKIVQASELVLAIRARCRAQAARSTTRWKERSDIFPTSYRTSTGTHSPFPNGRNEVPTTPFLGRGLVTWADAGPTPGRRRADAGPDAGPDAGRWAGFRWPKSCPNGPQVVSKSCPSPLDGCSCSN
eukprot:gene8873-biopygen22668